MNDPEIRAKRIRGICDGRPPFDLEKLRAAGSSFQSGEWTWVPRKPWWRRFVEWVRRCGRPEEFGYFFSRFEIEAKPVPVVFLYRRPTKWSTLWWKLTSRFRKEEQEEID